MGNMNLQNVAKLPHVCMVKIQSVYDTLKKAEKRAADLLLENPEFIAENTITEASELAGCSDTTWVRLAKRLGYNGFLALKADLWQHLSGIDAEHEHTQKTLYENVSADFSCKEIARRVFESSVDALNDTFNLLDEEEYSRAVKVLCKAKSIVLCGVGDAYAVVRSAYQKFFRAGFPVYESSDQDLQLIAISKLSPGDVLIAISYTGRTKNILELVKYARERDLIVLAITNFPISPLTKNADIVLQTAAFLQHANGEIVSKRITELCIIESLYVNMLLKSNVDSDQYLRATNDAININKV